jgi:hypothetical protein
VERSRAGIPFVRMMQILNVFRLALVGKVIVRPERPILE